MARDALDTDRTAARPPEAPSTSAAEAQSKTRLSQIDRHLAAVEPKSASGWPKTGIGPADRDPDLHPGRVRSITAAGRSPGCRTRPPRRQGGRQPAALAPVTRQSAAAGPQLPSTGGGRRVQARFDRPMPWRRSVDPDLRAKYRQLRGPKCRTERRHAQAGQRPASLLPKQRGGTGGKFPPPRMTSALHTLRRRISPATAKCTSVCGVP